MKFERKKLHKSLYKGLAKNKVKIQRKNKDYKRCLSGISGHGNKVSWAVENNNNENELSFVERAGIGKILITKSTLYIFINSQQYYDLILKFTLYLLKVTKT